MRKIAIAIMILTISSSTHAVDLSIEQRRLIGEDFRIEP
jgi:hypothetical protein